MSCTPITLTGINLDCGNVGGLSAIYIADIADVSGVTIASGEVTGISMTASKKFRGFKFRRGNANFESTTSRDDAAGTSSVQTVTTAAFNKMETAKRTEMEALSQGNTYIIALDANGLYWLIGYSPVMENTYNYGSVNASSGANMADSNQYSLTLTADTPELPFQIAAEFVTDLKTNVLS